jgi:DNA-binding LacI/PurR family transcriptional regulator
MKIAWKHPGRPPALHSAYRELADRIIQLVHKSVWPEGFLLPSRARLAKQFGVSEKVVRAALKHLGAEGRLQSVNTGWRVPSASKKSLHDNMVLMVLNVPPDTFYDPQKQSFAYHLRRGMEKTLHALNLHPLVLFEQKRNALTRVEGCLRMASLRGILLYGRFSNTCLSSYENLQVPVVLVDTPAGKHALSSAAADNEQAAFDCVERLAKLGHQRIAFIRRVNLLTSQIDPDSVERQNGFLRGLDAFGFKGGRSRIFNYVDRAEKPMLERLFQAQPCFTAFVGADRTIATSIGRYFQARNHNAPVDLSITAFADIHSPAPISGPRFDSYQMGVEAVKLLQVPERRQIRVAPTWNEGVTVGPAPAAKY